MRIIYLRLRIRAAIIQGAPMKPCSRDLREKIARALEAGDTQEQPACRFSVGLPFVEKLWRRRTARATSW